MSNKKLIIFDFDGVLADSFDAFYLLMRDAFGHIDLILTPHQYRNFFVGNVHQGFKDFINNEKKYPAFSKFRKTNYDRYYYDKKNKVKLYHGTVKFIKEIRKKYILTIASSGKKENIKNLLKKNGIKHLFNLILADSAFSKDGMLIKILKKFKSSPENTTMITDTVGDIKIAKKINLRTVAVTWGFHNYKALKKSKPDKLVRNFRELGKFLKI